MTTLVSNFSLEMTYLVQDNNNKQDRKNEYLLCFHIFSSVQVLQLQTIITPRNAPLRLYIVMMTCGSYRCKSINVYDKPY